MQTPTPDEARARSELLARRFPDDEGGPLDEKLALILGDDAPVVSSLTGRIIGPAGTPGVEVPDWLRPVAQRAMAMRAERHAVTGAERARRGAIGALRLRSFSAGPYSESYFGPGEAANARVLDPDPAIHELLWALATEEMRAYWLGLWTGAHPPAAGTTEFRWDLRRRRRGY